jgi:uncharacterized protein
MTVINITKESGIPLIGHLAFGIVCRGKSNLIQVRPTTICNLSCPFCSTDGGPLSKTHKTQYTVEPSYLIEEIKKIAEIKGTLHVNIDSVGEPTAYPPLIEFITRLKDMKEVNFISMQTNGTLLNKEKIQALEQAGLDRINLSIHAISKELTKKLAGVKGYDINQIKEAAHIINTSKIELLIAPVYLPHINDEEMKEIIAFAKELNCKIAIQKYEEYKYSRKMKEAKKQNFYKFYKQLKEWEKEFKIRLIYNAPSLNVGKAPSLQHNLKEGERINTKVLAQGWMKDQRLAAYKNKCITITNCSANINDSINARITETKNNIFLAEAIKTQKDLNNLAE